MPSRVVLNRAQVKLTAQTSATRLVRTTTRAVNTRAVHNAPGGPYSTGKLKSSISWTLFDVGTTVTGRSGSDLEHAIWVHEGTQPHQIRAARAANLNFFWRKAGRRFIGPKVNHPGQQPQPFLTDALLSVAPRYGFKVVITR